MFEEIMNLRSPICVRKCIHYIQCLKEHDGKNCNGKYLQFIHLYFNNEVKYIFLKNFSSEDASTIFFPNKFGFLTILGYSLSYRTSSSKESLCSLADTPPASPS